MADRRRRRRSSSNTESENSEGEETAAPKKDATLNSTKPKESECESEYTHGEETSEYDSTTEGYDEEETETEEEDDDDDETTEDIDDNDDVVGEEGFDADWIDEERQRGDGEEEPNSGKNLDDDEDKKNPAYIPRKGAFYEHDTRLGEEQKEEKEAPEPKKKLWTDAGRWDHDRYNSDQQAPKSQQEIIALYGYDIRSREKPPEASMRGNTNRRQPDRRKQFGDYMPQRDNYQSGDARDNYRDNDNYRDERSYERPYRGRGYQASPGRGGPRGRGPRPSRPPRSNQNYNQDNRSYTDYQNQRNTSPRYSDDIVNTDSSPEKTAYNRNVSDRDRPQEQLAKQHLDPKPIPPDVVPTGDVDSSSRDEMSGDQQVRTRFRQGTSRDHPPQNTDNKKQELRAHRTRGMRTRVQEYQPPDIDKSSQNQQHTQQHAAQQHAPAQENTFRGQQTPKTTSQDVRLMSIYPPVTVHTTTPTTTTTGERISSPRVSDNHPARVSKQDHMGANIPPVTKPHSAAPQGHIKLADNSQGRVKQVDSTRTKRYSSQRQRPPQEMAGYIPEVTRDLTIPPQQQPIMSQHAMPVAHLQGAMSTHLVRPAQQVPRPTQQVVRATQQVPRPTQQGPRPTLSSQPPRPRLASQPLRMAQSTQASRPTQSAQPLRQTQSAQPPPASQVPMPVMYNQLYARPPAVFRQPVSSVSSQSPPHTLSFPPAAVLSAPMQTVPFSLPATSQVQSPPRLHLGQETTLATANMSAAIPSAGGQTLIQGPYVQAQVINYVPPVPAPSQAAPSHYQMTGHVPVQTVPLQTVPLQTVPLQTVPLQTVPLQTVPVQAAHVPVQPSHVPVQFPAPNAPNPQAPGPEPVLIRGGTTYFSHEAPTFPTGTTYFSPEAQQPTPVRTIVTRRPMAAIPIINPQDVNQASHMYAEVYGDEDVEYIEEYTEYTEPYIIDDQAGGDLIMRDDHVEDTAMAGDHRVEYRRMADVVGEQVVGDFAPGDQTVSTSTVHQPPEDVSQRLTEDVSQRLTEDVSQRLTENVSQRLTEDVSQRLTEDVSQRLTEDVSQRLTEDVSQRLTEDVSQRLTEDVSQRLTEDVSQRLTEDVSQRLTENVSQRLTEDVSQRLTEDVSQRLTEDVSQRLTEDVSQRLTEDVSQRLTEDVSQRLTEDVSHSTTEDFSQRLTTESPELATDIEHHVPKNSSEGVTGDNTANYSDDNYTGNGSHNYNIDNVTGDTNLQKVSEHAEENSEFMHEQGLSHLAEDVSRVAEDSNQHLTEVDEQYLADNTDITTGEPSSDRFDTYRTELPDFNESVVSNTEMPEVDMGESMDHDMEGHLPDLAEDTLEQFTEDMRILENELEAVSLEESVRDTEHSEYVGSSVDIKPSEQVSQDATVSNRENESESASTEVALDAQLVTESVDSSILGDSTVENDDITSMDSCGVEETASDEAEHESVTKLSINSQPTSQQVTKQSTEKIMTEIKVVYTEAKET